MNESGASRKRSPANSIWNTWPYWLVMTIPPPGPRWLKHILKSTRRPIYFISPADGLSRADGVNAPLSGMVQQRWNRRLGGYFLLRFASSEKRVCPGPGGARFPENGRAYR